MSREHVPDEPARNNMLGENTPDAKECSECDGEGSWVHPVTCEREKCPECNGTGEEPEE